MSLKILVMSCDKNQDLYEPFYKCMEKYWCDHPEIIYSTESLQNPYYKTICKNYPLSQWTKRARETIKEIDSDYIMLTIDDLFIREKVNNKNIENLCTYLIGYIASINLEFSFDKDDLPLNDEIMFRNQGGRFKLSCMCQIWQKKALLDLFDYDTDPWLFEKNNLAKRYTYLISKYGNYINWGKRKDDWHWGIVKGKWARECKEFFDKENIKIDYSKRGFID